MYDLYNNNYHYGIVVYFEKVDQYLAPTISIIRLTSRWARTDICGSGASNTLAKLTSQQVSNLLLF